MQEPKTIELGKTYTWESLGGKSKLVETKDTFQYVPILDSLASIMQNRDIFSEVYVAVKLSLNKIKFLLFIINVIKISPMRIDGEIGINFDFS